MFEILQDIEMLRFTQLILEILGEIFVCIIIFCSIIKHIDIRTHLFQLNISAMLYLLMDILALLFRGDGSIFGYFMVRISNGLYLAFNYVLLLLMTDFLRVSIPVKNVTKIDNALLLIAQSMNILNLILLCFSQFTGFLYTFDLYNCYQRADYIVISFLLAGITFLMNAIVLFRKRIYLKKLLFWTFVNYFSFPFFSMVISFFIYGIGFTNAAVALSMIISFLLYEIEEAKKHLEYEKEINRLNNEIMLSQIQPHFLYNTLSTVQALCDTDPQAAKKIIEKFGMYLRQNMDFLNQEEKIAFEKELEHTKIYAEIEMVRFENIWVEYDTPDTEFSIPPLTIQPLVENSIKHGIRIREQGLVRIITRKQKQYDEIIVWDNGKGFDTTLAVSEDRTHIGIRNVRERIEKMCGGTMTVESHIGKGTTVTIRIPNSES